MEKEDKSASLNNFLGDEYFDYLYKFVSTEETNKLKDKKNDTTEIIEKFNKIRSYLNNLKNYDKRQKFIKDIQLKLKNEDIIFDDNPDLFAFENKIYDLQNHKFIEPKAEQYISITTGYKWENKDESLNKIEVDKIINTILSDAEIKKLYLTILSTGLDGRLTEKFTIANGSGGNGKGVINEFVYEMLGNYAYIIPSSILLDKIKSGANVEVSELHRKRLVITREPDSKSSINGATIKEITGGSDINSRGLYSSNTKTKLNLSLIMECNDKPKLDEANDAMARRILDIPFKNRFVDKNIYDELDEDEKTNTFLINSEYKTKEFKEKYRQALFLILCDYHKEYIKNNRSLPICKEILQRNKDYLQSSDEYYCWFKDNYEKTNSKKDIIKLKDIYDNFSHSNYFINLTKNEKRTLNYKAFVDRMQKNMFLQKYVGTNKDKIYIITNYKPLINDDDDDDDDKNALDL
jgi:phage/plasmid-associated DNA primase